MSAEVVEQVRLRFADDDGGLNATYNALAPNYGIPADLAISFNPADNKSPNFALADVSPEDWYESGSARFPLVTLFAHGLENRNWQKFHQFSGDVHVGVNVFLSWSEPRLKLTRFEPTAWCWEETMVTIFNRARHSFPSDQDWTESIVYNGDIGLKKTPVKRGAKFWEQALMFYATFVVDQRGDV